MQLSQGGHLSPFSHGDREPSRLVTAWGWGSLQLGTSPHKWRTKIVMLRLQCNQENISRAGRSRSAPRSALLRAPASSGAPSRDRNQMLCEEPGSIFSATFLCGVGMARLIRAWKAGSPPLRDQTEVNPPCQPWGSRFV